MMPVGVLAAMMALGAPALETFEAPGYAAPVCGVWYAPGETSSAMPLGGLGTGFVDLTSSGTFGACTTENTWLSPKPAAPKSGLTIRVGERRVALFPDGGDAPEGMRFWGHYPAADIDFGETFGDVRVYARCFAPLVPHDYDLSGLPVALFRLAFENRGDGPAPVEAALEWQAETASGLKAHGNVEGALGWRRPSLRPGEAWKVSPMLVFASSRDELLERARDARPAPVWMCSPDAVSSVPEGSAFRSGAVTDFFVDALGGFNWETHRRESAVFDGAPNIGQMFWHFHCGDLRAGRGHDGGYGLAADALPTATTDGAVEFRYRVHEAGPDTVALVFAIVNRSDTELRDLHFGFAVNADVGGPKFAEKQRAAHDDAVGGIVFEHDATPTRLALVGDADEAVVDRWPNAHRAMIEGAWTPLNADAPGPRVETVSDGIQMVLPRGSYAVASRSEGGWAHQNVRVREDVIRTLARRTLEAGERAEVTLALAWHFPLWTSSDGELLRHRYAERFADAGQVMKAALNQAGAIERGVVAWQEPIYASEAPPLLKDAVINALYVLPRNSWWLADGRFFQSESFTGCPITETFVCRFNGSFPLAVLFPQCEQATMRSVAEAQADSGEIPFGFGRPTASRSPYFQVQHPIVSSEFVLTAWRNFDLWRDEQHLEAMYPHVKAAIRYAMTLDKDGDGIVDEDPGSEKGFPANQYYDCWPWWGVSAYTGSIWLAALRAGEAMAAQMEDEAFAEELRAWYGRASAAFEEKLWTGRYYRLYNDPARKRVSDTSLTNALCGQWFAYTCGLGHVVPKDHVGAVIDTVLRLNVPATEFGAVNGVGPDGAVDETYPNHSAVVTIGEVWNFCAMAAFAGREDEAVRLFNTSYENILLRQRTPWNIPWSLDPQTGAIKWGINYYSNPCVWTLFQALAPQTYRTLAANKWSH